jgi:hypothetical protein
MRHGYGVCEYSNGVRYEGMWVKDEREGEGMMLFPNGDRIQGLWRKNMVKAGEGRNTSGAGDVYEGGLYTKQKAVEQDGSGTSATLRAFEVSLTVVKHGRGVFKYVSGNVYTGDWYEDRAEGQGSIEYADGTYFHGSWVGGDACDGKGMVRSVSWEYEGSLRFGKREGMGTCVWMDGGRYEGNWKADQRSGKGVMTEADGSWYDGLWDKEMRQGPGEALLRDGSEYSGLFQADMPHGKGKIKYPDGKMYEGDFVKGIPQGVGQITFPWGDVFCEFQF